MPQFQKSLTAPAASREWASQNRETIFAPIIAAMKQAFIDAGQAAPGFGRMELHTGAAPIPEP